MAIGLTRAPLNMEADAGCFHGIVGWQINLGLTMHVIENCLRPTHPVATIMKLFCFQHKLAKIGLKLNSTLA